MRRLFFARKAYSTHFTRRVEKNIFLPSRLKVPLLLLALDRESCICGLVRQKNRISGAFFTFSPYRCVIY